MTTGAEVSPSLRALLGGCVDYAGLFPPASLLLETALDNYAAYARSSEAWMLGCFVLPIAKLADAGRLLAGRFTAEHPLRISALGAKPASADEFLTGLHQGLRELADFQQMHGAAVRIEQLEAALPPEIVAGPELDSTLWEAANLIAESPVSLRTFWEVPFSENLPASLQGFARHNTGVFGTTSTASSPRFGSDGRMLSHSPVPHLTRCQPFGAKLRTGGLEAAAFPSPAQLAAALTAAHEAGVALKFTAGLHHPFRQFDAGVATHMHGFVNVYAAGALVSLHRASAAFAPTVLGDENPANFRFDAGGLHWRNRLVTIKAISAAREVITSFGSCSFDEPRDDLRALGLLP